MNWVGKCEIVSIFFRGNDNDIIIILIRLG